MRPDHADLGREAQSPDRMTPAIVLAAGRSSRMGRVKALLPHPSGGTLLSHVVATLRAGGAGDVVVVTGHESGAVEGEAHRAGARAVRNPDYEKGQLSSLLRGLDAIDRPGLNGVLVTLVDVPMVSAATVRVVLECYERTHVPVVRPTSKGRHGHPLFIDRSLFDRLRKGDHAVGAKAIVRAHASAAGDVEVADEGAFIDVDTPEEYEALFSTGPATS